VQEISWKSYENYSSLLPKNPTNPVLLLKKVIEGLTQALHLSKKQLTISVKIHTQKEVKDFSGGAGSSSVSQRRG